MITDHLTKAALSSAIVGVVLLLLRRAGPRAGGLAAAVPVNSMPALYWLWMERGDAFAGAAAAGSLWATCLTALLAWTFARLALARHAVPAPVTALRDSGDWRTGTPISMVAAGAMTLLVGELSRHGGAALCGPVARQGGAPTACLFLQGYLDGMLPKAVFLGALVSAWGTAAGAAAWPVALASAAIALMVQRRRRIST